MAVKGTISITGHSGFGFTDLGWSIDVRKQTGGVLICTVESRRPFRSRQGALKAAKRMAKRLGIDVTGQ